jgi:tetratricopeptide (TPR) repeat protein
LILRAFPAARRAAVLGFALCVGGVAQTPPGVGHTVALPELAAGRQALAARNYAEAERHFRTVLRADAANLTARMGVADAELGLHQYESAELEYRRVVAAEPQMWVAHKNLVIVEAALGRWEEFDRERALLRAARERGAEGISPRESDVIDGFTAGGRRWIVREYFVPVGRSQTRYNFESFAPDGRVSEYISLEGEAAAAQTQDAPVRIGDNKAETTPAGRYALDWYTGKAHGVVRIYPAAGQEPTYEQVRADVLRWLRAPKMQH